jgi:hypothetical protein
VARWPVWWLKEPAALLSELVRVSNKLVFVAVPNPVQVGYQVRKHIVEPEFVKEVDERWTDIGMIRRTLEGLGVIVLEQGVLDTPPWPTRSCLRPTAAQGRHSFEETRRAVCGRGWRWSTMDYYSARITISTTRDKPLAERWRLPWQIKQIWSPPLAAG